MQNQESFLVQSFNHAYEYTTERSTQDQFSILLTQYVFTLLTLHYLPHQLKIVLKPPRIDLLSMIENGLSSVDLAQQPRIWLGSSFFAYSCFYQAVFRFQATFNVAHVRNPGRRRLLFRQGITSTSRKPKERWIYTAVKRSNQQFVLNCQTVERPQIPWTISLLKGWKMKRTCYHSDELRIIVKIKKLKKMCKNMSE